MKQGQLKQRLAALTILVAAVWVGSCGDDDDPPNGPVIETGLTAVNGLHYRCVMGYDSIQPPLEFSVKDNDGNPLADYQVQFDPVEGDGALNWRSTLTDSTGIATNSYAFSGSLGHATVRARAGDDTVDVYLRANTLIPGEQGQGQYVLFEDTYADVKDYNGEPASVDIIQNPADHPIIYANYEAALGVVVMLSDFNLNKEVYDTTSVYGVIVNGIYDRRTPEGIGIGSPIDSLRSAYGDPEAIVADGGDLRVDYQALGMTYWCHSSDTSVLEMHIYPPIYLFGGDSSAASPSRRHNGYRLR